MFYDDIIAILISEVKRLFKILRKKIRLTFKGLVLLISIFISFSTLSGQYYGMEFSGHEYSLDQRSGLNLTPERSLNIKDQLDLQFYLRLEPERESYFGYIFRAIVGNQNIDLIYSIIESNPNNFELILKERTSKIAFAVPFEKMTTSWVKIRFELDFENQKITCYVNDTVIEDELSGYNPKDGLRLMFGAHSYQNFSTTDVPPMVLRDVEVHSKHVSYRWPLNEISGTIAHSVPEGSNGLAVNPEWLLKKHNTWNNILNLEVTGTVKSTFDNNNDDLYIVSTDTIYIYNVIKDSMGKIAIKSPYVIESANSVIFDTLSDRLILYSIDNNYLSVFDFETGEWSPHDPGTGDLTVFWHHNRLMTMEGRLFTFGGYGEFKYKNSVYVWDPDNNHFKSFDFKGNFYPRYLAGSGFNPSDSLFYIIGGFGSKSGKQSESPNYYFQILSFSLKDSTFREVAKCPDPENGFCFSNSVVFDNANNLYGLYFSKYQFDNQLQLVRIPIENPELVELGNPIRYQFLDINSYSDLYLSEQSNALVAVTCYTSEGHSSLSVYSIAFPPEAHTVLETPVIKNSRALIYFLLAAFTLIVGLLAYFFFIREKKRPSKEETEKRAVEPVKEKRENCIFLFGGFQVFDKEGKDITGEFTPLTKNLFILILLHTLRYEKGVSSNLLYETFWFNKSPKNARNNRAVNMLKLKIILDKLESASISKDTGYWRFYFDPSRIYIDYYEYLQIIHYTENLTRNHIARLQSLIESRSFLINTDAEWLDPFKSEISNEIIDAFLAYINKSGDDPEFLLHLTNCIFLYDMVSEEALKFQCRLLIKQGKHSLAKKAYSNFVKEYEQLYNEVYGVSFNDIISSSYSFLDEKLK